MAKPKSVKPKSRPSKPSKKPAAKPQRKKRAPREQPPLPDPLPLLGSEPTYQPEQNDPFSIDSTTSSTGNSEPSPGQPLTKEQECIIGSLPSSIGGEGEQPGAPSAATDTVSALMSQVAFEEHDVKDTLCELFDWMAEKFQSDHWKLQDRQARMLARPGTQLLNAMWGKLQTILPDALGSWCETTPGALGFITGCTLVVAPRIMHQMKISREKKQVKPGPKPVPPRPTDEGSMIFQEK